MRATGSLAVVVAALTLAAGAGASFPGEPGRLLFTQHMCPSGAFRCFNAATACTIDESERVPRRLAVPADSRISADGTRIAYVTNDGVYVANTDGSEAGLVFPGARGPSWSPDGTRLAVLVLSIGASTIATVGSDGSARITVATAGTGLSAPSDPAWSPDGRQIAFVRGGDLTVVDPDGTHGRLLTMPPGNVIDAPEWSPDGARVAFVRGRPGLPPEIWTIDREGRDARFVTFGLRPAWSSNGRTIAYVNGNSLWAADSVGGNARVLYRVPGFASIEPRWLTGRQDRALRTSGTCLREVGGGYDAGTDGPDALLVTGEDAQVETFAGDDFVWVTNDADPVTSISGIRIDGGEGDDVFVLDGGNDVVFGGQGNDVVTTSKGTGLSRRVSLGDGDDYALTSTGDDVIYGGAGDDRLFPAGGRDRVFAGPGNDRIDAFGLAPKVLDGGAGDDRIRGGRGPDRLIGGPDRDDVDGRQGADRISVQDGDEDVAHCRGGIDVVLADRRDRVEGRCRRIQRR
jgi:Ca2+-binding RTX toxin-like protein